MPYEAEDIRNSLSVFLIFMSSFQAALSKKISEYHLTGYIDDLIDVHFADAHCIKKRISEQDSQLEVTHHAGNFSLLDTGNV